MQSYLFIIPKRLFIFFLLFFIIETTSYGQFSDKMVSKFGQVSKEQLEKNTFAEFPDADAVILFETCDVTTNFEQYDLNSRYYTYLPITKKKVHRRIKILKKTGLDQGNVNIEFAEMKYSDSDKSGQSVSRIKATTYVLKNGRVAEYSISKKDHFEKTISERRDREYKEISFAFPNMKEGCIIEYQYTIESIGFGYDQWTFQNSIPTIWSEYFTQVSEAFTFNTVIRGYFKPAFTEQTTGEIYDSGKGYVSRNIHIAYQNLPSFKKEEYLTTSSDYMQAIRFEYTAIKPEGAIRTYYLSGSYPSIAKSLNKSDGFGDQLQKERLVSDLVTSIVKDGMSDKEKMEAIHKYITKNFKYNGKNAYISKAVKKTLSEKTGDAADLNLLMLLMMKEARLNALLKEHFSKKLLGIACIPINFIDHFLST